MLRIAKFARAAASLAAVSLFWSVSATADPNSGPPEVDEREPSLEEILSSDLDEPGTTPRPAPSEPVVVLEPEPQIPSKSVAPTRPVEPRRQPAAPEPQIAPERRVEPPPQVSPAPPADLVPEPDGAPLAPRPGEIEPALEPDGSEAPPEPDGANAPPNEETYGEAPATPEPADALATGEPDGAVLVLEPVPAPTEHHDPLPAPAALPAPLADLLPPKIRRTADRLWQTSSDYAVPWLTARAASLPPAWRERLGRFAERATQPAVRTAALSTALVLAIGLLIARRVRGKGDLIVCLDYPSELDGHFSVSIGRRSRRAELTSRGRGGRRDAASTKTEHHSVSKETHFRKLRPGHYWVLANGELKDPETGDAVCEQTEELSVRVYGRRTVRLAFSFHPAACPVDVRVLWDKRQADEASVAAIGRPDTLRHTRNRPARLLLPKGQHVIAVGSRDRVGETTVDVESHRPTTVEIALAGSENVLFKGCPPAVGPYLAGDFDTAAHELEREGQVSLAALLRARRHQARGELAEAATCLEAAERWSEAAAMRIELGELAAAGALYLRAGDPAHAGAAYRQGELWQEAGEAFEAAEDMESAVACFREAGETSRVILLLERQGRAYEAAELAEELGDRSRVIRLLQQVSGVDENYTDASLRLIDAYENEGHLDLAAQRLAEHLRRLDDDAPGVTDLRSRQAELLERGGETENALQALEELRRIEPTYPNVATRIEALRKQLSESQSTTAARPSVSAPTEFLSGSRYEILEQIGRGGMGIVFRARDRRLGRIVALKRLPENLRDHPKAVELFLREARAAAALNHPNIVTLFDADQEDGTFFITMELLEGHPLNTILKKRDRLGERDVARLGVQIAAGLGYAHERGIVHRDVKTANLFFTRDRVVKIMDFGLAKMVEEVRKSSTVIGGTPFYMAPEQSTGGAVDHRADLYALGVTFFELLTGNCPFRDGDIPYHHRNTPPPLPPLRPSPPRPDRWQRASTAPAGTCKCTGSIKSTGSIGPVRANVVSQ
ncbi:MAG: protein kinase [Proteobacteria bacterium]|nr:protein kinase [Pseudomonadota bacterium]